MKPCNYCGQPVVAWKDKTSDLFTNICKDCSTTQQKSRAKCPDFFQDPYEDFCKDAKARCKILTKSFNDIHLDTTAWTGLWLGFYAENNENAEMNSVTMERLVVELLMKIECSNMIIAAELKQMNKRMDKNET